jgi:hypothetical protein
MFPSDKVVVHGRVAEYDLKPEAESVVTRTFCPVCGSGLFGRNTRMPGFVTVSVGTLDDPDGVVPQVVVFTRTRRRWDQVDPDLPSFETQPNWSPEDGV